MTDATAGLLFSTATMRFLPVALVNVVACVYLFRVAARRAPRDPLRAPARWLALYFLSLASLALCQVGMSSAADPWLSFYCNHIGQSVSVAFSIPPLVLFSASYLSGDDPPLTQRVGRVAGWVAVGAAVVVAAAFVIDAVATDSIRYDFEAVHGRKLAVDEPQWQALITGFVFVGDCVALGALLLRARRSTGLVRRRTLQFSGVVVAAVVAVVLYRLESVAAVPPGTYPSFLVAVTLGAILLFMGSTDDITSFRERTTSLVLVVVVGVSSALAQAMVVQAERAHTDGLRAVARVAAVDAVIDDARIIAIADVVVVDGVACVGSGVVDGVCTLRLAGAPRGVTFSALAVRRAVHAVAWPLALLLLGTVTVTVLVVPRLAQWSVLGPLTTLTEAEAAGRARGTLLAQLSHDLRTPLHALLFHVRELSVDEQGHQAGAARAGERLRALIDRLLTAGRDAQGALTAVPANVDVRAFVDDVVAGHAARAQASGRAVALHLAAAVPRELRFDRVLVLQVLDNLIENALKYSDAGDVDVDVDADAATVFVRVVDRGRGVPLHLQPRIFEPFFQHNAVEGFGLGLSSAQQAAAALGGSVTLDSVPGRGTTATLRWPRVDVVTASAAVDVNAVDVNAIDVDVRAAIAALARAGDVAALADALRRHRAGASPEAAAVFDAAAALLARYELRALRRLFDRGDP